MNSEFEFRTGPQEALVVVSGAAAAAVGEALFGRLPGPGLLRCVAWSRGLEPAAICWLPPDRLEIRVAAGQLSFLLERLRGLQRQTTPASALELRVRQLQARLEVWSYSDSDPGSGPAESMAGELTELSKTAPNAVVKRAIDEAHDALDDGLPAELVAGKLDRVLSELKRETTGQASGLDPSVSG